MRSQGTKETQGINGDAAALQRQLDAAAALSPTSAPMPCPYPRHRGSDWRLASHEGVPVTCGICYPPPPGLDIEPVPALPTHVTDGQEVPAHAT